jgi:CRP-like cAMP-binding protein
MHETLQVDILQLVTREEVWRRVTDRLRPEFGRLLDVRDVRRVRRVVGDAWIVTVVLVAPSGDLHVADLNVEDNGVMTPQLNADHVVDAAKNQKKFVLSAVPDELSDFGDAGPSSDAELSMLEELSAPLDTQIADAMAKGDRASLQTARELLPRMLADHDQQGATLFKMAEVEMKLGEPLIAKGYLEAAARELADRFDLNALEKAAALALELVGKDGFSGSPVHTLLEQSRARLRPLDSITGARSFAGLPEDVRARLDIATELRTLAPGETLVAEGSRSQNVFVVKSGLLGVWLEKPEGGSWLVRCCFPGWLLGESSVLDTTGEPRCTATLKAERVSEVWTIPAAAVKSAMDEDLAFGLRIAQTKQMHRIDSFFSMHETMGQLDVQVRDEMLSCIQRLSTFDEDTVILVGNEIPDVACLVARGSIGLYEQENAETPASVIEPDSFYGVRDAIHRIAPSMDAVARAGSTIAFFDAAKLQKLCERSPEQVVAVLERLG